MKKKTVGSQLKTVVSFNQSGQPSNRSLSGFWDPFRSYSSILGKSR